MGIKNLPALSCLFTLAIVSIVIFLNKNVFGGCSIGEEEGTHLNYVQTGVIMVCNEEAATQEFLKYNPVYYEHSSNFQGTQVCRYHQWCNVGGYAVYSQIASSSQPYVYFLILYPHDPECLVGCRKMDANFGNLTCDNN